MGIMDKLTAGAERAAKEGEKVFDKGRAKVGELRIEMQMDGLAKKLGYLVFDFYRGREVDQAVRQKMLDDLSRLEDQLMQTRAEAAARAQAAEAAKSQGAAPGAAPAPDPGDAAGAAPGVVPDAGPAGEAAQWPADAPGATAGGADETTAATDDGTDPLQEDDFAPPAAS